MHSINPKGFDIILGSQSPRRKALMEQLGYRFTQLALNVDESYPNDLKVDEIAEYLSLKKAHAFDGPFSPNTLLITSDTTVCIGDEQLGKAKDSNEAGAMLKKLSNEVHEVITGVTLKSQGKTKSFSVKTEVKMKKLSAEEIEYYIVNYQPYDKAGAYGIQEWIGFIGVEYIKGSYYNVMGLPLKELYEEILKF